MNRHRIPALLLIVFACAVAGAQATKHVVAKGETLYSIARHYGVSVDSIISANGIKDASKILPGLSLIIPGTLATRSYIVQKGDTLYSIARAHGMSVDELKSINTMTGSTIVPGQSLLVRTPDAAPSPPVSVAPSTKPVPEPQAPKASASAVSAGMWPVSGELSRIQGKLAGAAIATKPGVSISAVRAGTVISAGPFRSFGNMAFVQASDGLVYVYGGAATLRVRVGDVVRKGSVLGLAEADGDGKASVYFFVFRGGDSMDPEKAPRD